jgi:hypothetical protein
MDGQRFDELTRAFAAGSASRRALFRGLAGAAAGSVLALVGSDRASADKKKDKDKKDKGDEGCKPAGKPQSRCVKDAQCCSGLVCQDRECQPGCHIDGRFYAPNAPHPASPCLACLPAVSTVAWSTQTAGVACDDGDPCTSSDVCDGAGSCAGTLDPPVITCPASPTIAAATGTCGAVATFEPAVTCATAVTCTPASGTNFAVGSTEVTCTASNEAGSTACAFDVVVEDREAPAITCPAPIAVDAIGGAAVPVSFVASAMDNCGGASVSCDPPSGSSFKVGRTSVTCTATDDSDETRSCAFDVVVTCVPDCAGKACGASDGCGGTCVGPCPNAGPCATSVCDETSKTCVTTNKPLGTSCSDACTFNAICDGNGDCINGFTPGCPDNTTNPCRERFGTCDPAVGCVYDLLPAGTECDTSDLCNIKTCTADGFCQANSPVQCDPECQTCDPSSGACIDRDGFRLVCGEGSGYCVNGSCESPCDSICDDPNFCFEEIPAGQQFGSFFCCPRSARLPGGGCCWVANDPGIVVDGVCYHPRRVCADGKGCAAECCGSSSTGYAGVCPGPDEYCVGDAAVPANQACTDHNDCVAIYGGFAVCAGADWKDGPSGPVPVEDSGICCPGYLAIPSGEVGPFGAIYSCCSQGTRPNIDGRGCCRFPDYLHGCSGCNCSFNGIRRCCG